jgi:hypothetical protein
MWSLVEFNFERKIESKIERNALHNVVRNVLLNPHRNVQRYNNELTVILKLFQAFNPPAAPVAFTTLAHCTAAATSCTRKIDAPCIRAMV